MSATDSRPCLLVVEDSPTTMAVLSKHLSGHFEVIGAKDGEEAWKLLQRNSSIELVITDVNMPNMSGFELLRHIRESDKPEISGLPVFIMTTDDDESEKHQALVNGANDFITKPINPLVLRARVNVHHKAAQVADKDKRQKKLEDDPTLDPLTGFHNTETFLSIAKQEIDSTRKNKKPLALFLVEIERFREIDEQYGIQAAENTLLAVAKVIAKITRGVDIIARIGDCRFAILLPDTKRLSTTMVSQRIRTTIEKTKVETGDQSFNITASIGIAVLPDDQSETIQQLLDLADGRISVAWNLGGNRICVNDKGDENFSE